MDIFEYNKPLNDKPLADILRPDDLSDVIGQEHLLGKGGSISRLLESSYLPSMILWGAPGCGKTTIARLIAKQGDYHFEMVSAVANGAADLKKIFKEAAIRKKDAKNTLLMVDEIHRFNRAQQDLFLPYIEDGTVSIVGATTENPSFELNSALLSRCKVMVLNRLEEESLKLLLKKAEQQFEKQLEISDNALKNMCHMADGDGRYFLNMCEELLPLNLEKQIDESMLAEILQKRFPIYDKNKDGHYNLISAFHKSLRGSDANAGLYWFARMMDAGEDPLYILRRLIRFAVEDIGLADPSALLQANAAHDAYKILGSPEGDLAVAQAVIYMATAPKSNAGYAAFKSCIMDVKSSGSFSPPKYIMNAPTKLMKDLGYKEGYIYDHDTDEGCSGQNYFPEEVGRREYYEPLLRGFERDIKKRMDYWDKIRRRARDAEINSA